MNESNKILPAVSVIMPVYNGENFLEKSISSVLNQSFDDFELIIVDDKSTDNSLSICKTYERIDSRIKVYSAKENKGTSVGNIWMYEDILGEYIMCLDQDDWYESDAIEKAYKAVKRTNSDIVVFGYNVNDNFKSKFELHNMELDNNSAMEKLMEDSEIQAYFWNKIYKRNVFLMGHHKWPNDLETFEDFSVMPYIFENTQKVTIITDVLYHYYQNPRNFSNKTKKSVLNYYLAKSYWIRVDFLVENYSNLLNRNPALNKAFVNTLGVWKQAFLTNDKRQRNYARDELRLHKNLLKLADITFLKRLILGILSY